MIVEKARAYAAKSHHDINQKYHDQLYVYHLQMVVNIAIQYINLIPEEDRDEVIAGCWVHDIIEDARRTYNSVKRNTNETVAEYAYALTNEKGRNRKERANHLYYKGIKEYKHAVFIKLCDRFANVKYSKDHGSPILKMYQKEMLEFELGLYDGRYQKLWDELRKMII